MRNRLIGSFLGSILAVVAVLAFSPVILAQTAAQSGAARVEDIRSTPDGKPDLSGVWSRAGTAVDGTSGFGWLKMGEEPPMQPWAAERYRLAREGTRNATVRGRDELDPILYPACLPHGTPRAYLFFAVEIVQAPGRVYILYESNHQVRRIYTDGREVPEGWPPSFMGYSIGRWDGDTLVVETEALLGLKDRAWIDTLGHPHTDALRVVERIRRVDHNTLEIDFLFDDPKAYTKPWGGKKVFHLKPDWEIMEQIVCEDRLKEEFFRNVFPPGTGQ